MPCVGYRNCVAAFELCIFLRSSYELRIFYFHQKIQKKLNPFLILNRLYVRRGDKVNKFEAFLKALLKSVFKEYPYDKERAKTSFETIKNSNKQVGENNGDKNKRCAKST